MFQCNSLGWLKQKEQFSVLYSRPARFVKSESRRSPHGSESMIKPWTCGLGIDSKMVLVLIWRVCLQKMITLICIYFQKSSFYLRIPSNINQTSVGLFWLSNNNLNKYRWFTKLMFIESMFFYILKLYFIAKAVPCRYSTRTASC